MLEWKDSNETESGIKSAILRRTNACHEGSKGATYASKKSFKLFDFHRKNYF